MCVCILFCLSSSIINTFRVFVIKMAQNSVVNLRPPPLPFSFFSSTHTPSIEEPRVCLFFSLSLVVVLRLSGMLRNMSSYSKVGRRRYEVEFSVRECWHDTRSRLLQNAALLNTLYVQPCLVRLAETRGGRSRKVPNTEKKIIKKWFAHRPLYPLAALTEKDTYHCDFFF